MVEPLSTHTVPAYDFRNFTSLNHFNSVLWTYVMHISSSVCFKDQTWTWGWPEICRNI